MDDWIGKMVTIVRLSGFRQRAILRETGGVDGLYIIRHGNRVHVRHVENDVFKQIGWEVNKPIKQGSLK